MYTARIIDKATLHDLDPLSLELTGNEKSIQVLSIAGLNPPTAQINLTKLAAQDGAIFNSATVNTRNIVVNLKINEPAELMRNTIYGVCRVKEQVRFEFSNDTVSGYCDGYIDNITCDLFEKSEVMQISIICPNPNFIGDTEQTITLSTTETTYFTNGGNAPSGFIATIALNTAANSITLIGNSFDTGALEISYNFQINDIITINTKHGEKSVSLKRGNVTTNLIGALEEGSNFGTVIPNQNTFTYLVYNNSNNRTAYTVCQIKYYEEYRGV